MSTILQPCFESSRFMDTATVKLKFAPPKPLEASTSASAAAKSSDLCGLSFQQVLANICSAPNSKETTDKEAVYVHPLSKKSSFSRLSEKSFEMCTENLGSETGTDILDSSILSLSPSTTNNSPSPREKSSSPREYSKNYCKANNSRNFPPPLTTISGANSIQVRPHREDGRLVIRAVESPAKHTYLRAERSNGRLRLSLLKDDATEFDSQVMADQENEEDEIDVPEKNESNINDEDLDQEIDENYYYCYNKSGDDEDDDDDEESDAQMGASSRKDDNDGNNFDIEVEMGMEKFQRLRRCNEGGHSNKGLYNWEPLWVATS